MEEMGDLMGIFGELTEDQKANRIIAQTENAKAQALSFAISSSYGASMDSTEIIERAKVFHTYIYGEGETSDS